MAPTLPDATSLATLSDAELTAILDLLFEPNDDLHTLALPTLRAITFASYPELVDTIRDQLLVIAESVHADPTARKPLHSILGSHPRLGEKKVHSSQSAAEQAQLQSGAAEEAERLAALNREYEAKFPGLRYVVFVNGRGRDVIMEDMRRRIDRDDLAEEEKEAIVVSQRTAPLMSTCALTASHRPWRTSPRTGPVSSTKSRTSPRLDDLPSRRRAERTSNCNGHGLSSHLIIRKLLVEQDHTGQRWSRLRGLWIPLPRPVTSRRDAPHAVFQSR